MQLRPFLQRHRVAATVLLGALAAGAGLLLAPEGYREFVADDAYISLRYARQLVDGNGLVFNEGERVEGYSNLLWLLLTALLGALGVEWLTALRLLGISCTVAAFVAVSLAARPRSVLAAGMTALLITATALMGPVAAWAWGGLEQPLVLAALAWSILLAYRLIAPDADRRRWVTTGVALALLCLCRADAFVLAGAVVGGLILARGLGDRASWVDALRLAAWPAGAVLAQLLFRLGYYGDWVANTARVKVAFTHSRLRTGWEYWVEGVTPQWPLLLATALLLAVVLWRAPSDGRRSALRRLALPLTAFLGWSAYVIILGGDIFPANRLLSPLPLLAALAAAEGLRRVDAPAMPHRLGYAAGAVALLVVLQPVQAQDPENLRAQLERWEIQGESLARLMTKAWPEPRPLWAASALGAIGFYYDGPMLDMLGLTDKVIARSKHPGFGHGWIGHELGNATYVLARAPGMVTACGPTGGATPCAGAEIDLFSRPPFRENYTIVVFSHFDPVHVRSGTWLRRDHPVVGIARGPEAVRVPAYLLNERPAAEARLSPGGMAAWLGQDATLQGSFDVPAGRWSLHVEGAGAYAVSVTSPEEVEPRDGVLPVDHPGGTMQVEVRALEGQEFVHALELRRA